MATTRKKVSAKAPVKSAPKKAVVKKTAAKKTVKKAAVKAPPAKKAAPAKKAVKTGKAAAPKKSAVKKSAVKKAVKKVVKKAAVKKTAVKAVAKKAVKKTAAKAAVKKSVAKKPIKALTRTASRPRLTAPPKTTKAQAKAPAAAVETPVAKPVVPAPAPAPEAAKALKGLKVGGALGARIAQIVAESARPKPVLDAPLAEIEDVPRDELTDVSRPLPSSGKDADPVEVAHKAAALLFAKKAEDMVLLDLRNLSTVADYYLICTCQNEPQMRAMLNDVQRTLSREGIKSLRSEYMSGVRWAIIDYGDLIIHLFESQTRGFYSLERLWADAPSTRLKAEDYALAEENDTDEDDDL